MARPGGSHKQPLTDERDTALGRWCREIHRVESPPHDATASPGPQGAAVEEELTGGMGIDTPGATWTDVTGDPTGSGPVAEFPLLTASGVAASPDVEDGAGGAAAGSAEAGGGADGVAGSLATVVVGATCKGAAAPAAGGSGLWLISVVVEPFDAAAVLVEWGAAGFAVGAAAAVCTV